VLTHAPVLHTWASAQRLLQPPQWAPLEAVSTHAPSQSVCPTGHTQRPPEHAVPTGHATPQPPQLPLSDAVSVQPSLHIERGAAQPVTSVQRLAMHTCVEVQRSPQPPQCDSSVRVSRQKAPQRVSPCGHPTVAASAAPGHTLLGQKAQSSVLHADDAASATTSAARTSALTAPPRGR
jgi:hypothetical protein